MVRAFEVEAVAVRSANVRVPHDRGCRRDVAIQLQSPHRETVRAPSIAVEANVLAGRVRGEGCLLLTLTRCALACDDGCESYPIGTAAVPIICSVCMLPVCDCS